MILSKSALESSKIFAQRFQAKIKIQIVKFAVFLIITVIMASIITSQKAIQSYTYNLSQSRLINKNTRGIFPPLAGSPEILIGKWEVEVMINLEGAELELFKNYTLQFQKDSQVKIVKKMATCNYEKEYYLFDWNTYSYNLFISSGKHIKPQAVSSQISEQNSTTSTNQPTQTENNSTNPKETTSEETKENKDESTNEVDDGQNTETKKQQELPIFEQCFIDGDIFLEQVESFTVWTYIDNQLYFLAERAMQSETQSSIFVLKKKNLKSQILP